MLYLSNMHYHSINSLEFMVPVMQGHSYVVHLETDHSQAAPYAIKCIIAAETFENNEICHKCHHQPIQEYLHLFFTFEKVHTLWLLLGLGSTHSAVCMRCTCVVCERSLCKVEGSYLYLHWMTGSLLDWQK